MNESHVSRGTGWPDRSPDLNALPGFKSPPPGYGEVPFWWWTGEDLDVDRMLWQVRTLHEKGISGFQVNYSHLDTRGWPTDSEEPRLFTEAWWKVYGRISEECGKLGMGIGLSTYTLDWPDGGKNLFYDLFYSKPELNAIELVAGDRVRLKGGESKTVRCMDDCFAARAYEVKNGLLQRGGIDLTPQIKGGEITWAAPDGEWEVWTFGAKRHAGTLNPLMSGSGDTVIRGFYQQFEDHNPGGTSKGLNYFFNDELKVGLGKYAWNNDFAAAFQERKGYDLMEVLPAMWSDLGDVTPKVRIDYADIRMSLMEERYFKPIHDWHAERGIIFGCDNHGRGLQPEAYGDYYRANRWYTAPGHDTPGGKADVIKGKVSSSIANLYNRPRVQLEGYHSLGWGATLEQMMFATRENYLYGCNLFSLHGFYYTTRGSHWEWAPPSYHFRMPYWSHMGTFLKYFDRLSYLMSQGHHVCDVAVIYPVTPYEAGMNGNKAKDVSFHIGGLLMSAGINFDFIDHQSLARADVKDGRLVLEDVRASYRVLVVPEMKAMRWASVEKAAAFAEAGGKVYVVGEPPLASDRAGLHDSELVALNERAFKQECRFERVQPVIGAIQKALVHDVRGVDCTVRYQHRKVGPRDVYMVMDARPGNVVEFRAKGAAELWDPWTGETKPLRVVGETETGTQVELPLEEYEAQVVVFTPGQAHLNPPEVTDGLAMAKELTGPWQVNVEPTMDNRFGDFRLPVTDENRMIGVEARRFAWAKETEQLAKTAMLPETDDSGWTTQLHGYGPKGYLLGPVPESADPDELDARLAGLKRIEPAVPVNIDGRDHAWQPCEFSWRYGKEDDPGHQGYHGLKGTFTDDFLRLGRRKKTQNGVTTLQAEEHKRYYFWTCAMADDAVDATIHASIADRVIRPNSSPRTGPAAIFVNGQKVDPSRPVSLTAGANPLLARFDDWGEGHVVLRRSDLPVPEHPEPLAMRWYKDPGVIPFAPDGDRAAAEWFRFVTAPGTAAIRIQSESREPVQAWMNGQPMIDRGSGRFEPPGSVSAEAVIALRLVPPVGQQGGAAITEPIVVETRSGVMPLGDWSKVGILHNYSGGVRYRTTVTLSEGEADGRVEIDLGRVVATAEVIINGQKAGVRVAPPWKLEVSGLLKEGENKIEVLVFNTLSNHYQTIPSLYRGDPTSGLFGPVRLLRSSP